MSFDLIGRIKLKDDGASRTLDKVRRTTKRAAQAQEELQGATRMVARAQEAAASSSRRLGRSMERARNAAFGTRRAMRSTASSMGAAARQTAGLSRQVAALGAAYLTAKGAKGLFDKTFKAAAEYEMREVTVKAMFGKESEKNARKYLDYVQSRADVSMFTMDDFLDAGKSFIPTTKDNNQLKRMLNLAERLGAMDPEQGLTGGAYALREFFSGDAISLVERFEIPRSVVNQWKKLPLEQQLKQLDKYFDKIGASNELLEAQSQTSLGQYRRALGQINRAFREMGTEGLRKVNPLLQEFNKWLNGADFAKLKAWGTDMFSGLVSGAVNAVRKASAYINDNFINNPEFQKLPDLSAKIKFIFDTLMEDFNSWYSSSGKAGLEEISKKAVDTIGYALKTSEPLLEAAKKIGVDAGKALVSGIMGAINANPVASSVVFGGVGAVVGGVPGALIGGAGGTIVAGIQGGKNRDELVEKYNSGKMEPEEKKLFEETGKRLVENNVWKWPGQLFGHNGGLDRVPYNGYPARLHAGETVLPREEAKRYRGESGTVGGGGSTRPFNINISSLVVREEADIEKIAKRLAYEIAQ